LLNVAFLIHRTANDRHHRRCGGIAAETAPLSGERVRNIEGRRSGNVNS
jgi:hypothetical protein